jgi:amino acid transporter
VVRGNWGRVMLWFRICWCAAAVCFLLAVSSLCSLLLPSNGWRSVSAWEVLSGFALVVVYFAAGVLLLRYRRGLRRTRGFPISTRPDEPREAGERRSGEEKRDQAC